VHLGDPDLGRDLRLRQPLEEAELDDPAFPLVERFEPRPDERAVLEMRVRRFLVAEGVHQVAVALVVGRSRERARRVGVARFQGVDDVLFLDLGGSGQLRDGGRAPEVGGQVVEQASDLQVELLQPARDVECPRLVTEVPSNLAHDRRHGIGRQLDPAVEVETVDRLDQTDRADLDEVLDLLAAARVARGQRPHERQHLLDETITSGPVTVLVVGTQQFLVAPLFRRDHPASAATEGR
jgi:hypothetical protein